jgi:hypothetical protein
MKPAWQKKLESDLRDGGVTVAELEAAKAEYAQHNINLNRVPRRGWRIFGMGVGAGPTTVTCWANLESLVKDRQSFIARFKTQATGA